MELERKERKKKRDPEIMWVGQLPRTGQGKQNMTVLVTFYNIIANKALNRIFKNYSFGELPQVYKAAVDRMKRDLDLGDQIVDPAAGMILDPERYEPIRSRTYRGGPTGEDREVIDEDEKKKLIEDGLATLRREPYLDEGRISKEEADTVALEVKKAHPVFKSIKVIEGKKPNTIVCLYSASNEQPGKETLKEEDVGQTTYSLNVIVEEKMTEEQRNKFKIVMDRYEILRSNFPQLDLLEEITNLLNESLRKKNWKKSLSANN